MPTPARRSSDDRRRELVEAALRVMARDGVAAATTRAITAEAGMSQSRFHYCFRPKAELLHEVVATMVRNQLDSVLGAVRSGGDVGSALRAYCRHLTENPERHQLSYELTQYALRTPGLAELAAQQYRTYLDATAEVLAVVRARVPARLVVAVLEGITLQWLVDRDDAAALDTLYTFAEQFERTAA